MNTSRSFNKGSLLERGRSRKADREGRIIAEGGIPADVLRNPMNRPGKSGKRNAHKDAALGAIGGVAGWIWNKSKVLSVVLVLVLVIGVVSLGDSLINGNRIYEGVTVGDIDLSGKTIDEATELIAQEYAPRVNDNYVVLYANEQAVQNGHNQKKRATLEEQMSYEDSITSRDRWTLTAEKLGVVFDPAAYALDAYQVGREDGGLFGRLQAQFTGAHIEPSCSFNEASINELRDEIIAALGEKMVNFDVKMVDSQAQVTDGHDGYEVSIEWLEQKINEALLKNQGESSYIIEMNYTPIQITREAAESCANIINNSICQGIDFQYGTKNWHADVSQVASWVTTEVVEDGNRYSLAALLDESKAKAAVIDGVAFELSAQNYRVEFFDDNDGVMVKTNATGNVPQVGAALDQLNDTLFTNSRRTSAPVVNIESAEIPEVMTFEDARDYGLIVEIESFTTQYASGAEARNKNIHIAADTLNFSIAKAGETWSFLALSGETTPEKGYQEAGAIIGDEYSDAIGGGICQVATTVYNAVYLAGYPIEKRYNHSLYIASYPEGRDAAIAYPDLDLVWRNDTDSDVLLVMSYTNSSVTATLYGVDPGYQVSTSYGEWAEGQPFKTVIKQDPDYPVGTEFVESSGADGRSITIVRTVKDKDGNVVSEKSFHSNYQPKNKVVVQGSKQPTSTSTTTG